RRARRRSLRLHWLHWRHRRRRGSHECSSARRWGSRGDATELFRPLLLQVIEGFTAAVPQVFEGFAALALDLVERIPADAPQLFERVACLVAELVEAVAQGAVPARGWSRQLPPGRERARGLVVVVEIPGAAGSVLVRGRLRWGRYARDRERAHRRERRRRQGC